MPDKKSQMPGMASRTGLDRVTRNSGAIPSPQRPRSGQAQIELCYHVGDSRRPTVVKRYHT